MVIRKKKPKPNKKERRKQEDLQAIDEGTTYGGGGEILDKSAPSVPKMETAGGGTLGKIIDKSPFQSIESGKTETSTKPELKKITSGSSSSKETGVKSSKTETSTKPDLTKKTSGSSSSKETGVKSDEPEPKRKPGRPVGSKGSAKGSSKGSTKDSTPQVTSNVQQTTFKQPAPSNMIPPSRIGIQNLREAFEEAKIKKKLSVSETSQYMILYDEWRDAQGNKPVKKVKLDALKALYKNVLYKK